MRKKIVAGNWKMNKNMEEGLSLASEIIHISKDEINNSEVQIILNPPFIHLSAIAQLLKESTIALGAQNCYEKESGAYTGEISVQMLKSVPVTYTIIGHSERREYFEESNEMLKNKTDLLLATGITPIFCCGESLEIREAGTHVDFVNNQIKESLFDLSAEDFQKIVIAYEPIWAIGTGKTATAAQAQDMQATIRQTIANKYGQEVAEEISILYGGSVKPANAKELFACPDVDGGLIGGASLKARDFIEICKSF